jgi:hypothetical protein
MKQKPWIPVVLFLVALLTGCATIHYMGESYPPTQHADLFFSEDDIQREYKVIGRMEATADADELVYSTEKFTEEILKKACAKGADAVVILDFKNVVTGINETTSHSESIEKGRHGKIRHEHENTEQSIEEKRRVEALIIKYQD